MTTENTTRPVLFMAGGTGGHIFPALAIAEKMQQQAIPVQWLGSQQGMEGELIPKTGITLHTLAVTGLRGKGLTRLFAAPFRLLAAVWQAIRLLRTIRPRLVIGMGGFASGPGGIAAWILGIPLCIHEQNAVAGLTNSWLAKMATVVMQAFPYTFPPHYKAITTGNPLRSTIHPQPKKETDTVNILIIGGSLGAKILNETVPVALQHVSASISVRHQTGKRHYEAMQAAYHDAAFPVELEAFIDDMGAAYAWADIVICRAGALTVSELAQAGVGSILIPFPHAVDDHQTRNAEFLVENNAAILVPQSQLTVEKLTEIVQELSENQATMLAMSEAALACATPEATAQVTQYCLDVALPANKKEK